MPIRKQVKIRALQTGHCYDTVGWIRLAAHNNNMPTAASSKESMDELHCRIAVHKMHFDQKKRVLLDMFANFQKNSFMS